MTHAAPHPDAAARLPDRFRGVLLGLAVGDALGAPLEFQPARTPEHYLTEMIGGGWQKLAPGEWTDDTQQALCIVESLLTKRVFDPDDIARRFVIWMQSSPKDIGLHTRRVLDAIRQGDSWETASREAQALAPENAPNGSLMRCAPLALFFCRHPEYVASLSGLGRSEAVELAYDAIDGGSQALKDRIGLAMQPTCEIAPTGYVLDTLEVAVWAFLHTTTFEDAVINAVNRGADADTVGAVVGALAGARYGMSSIPSRWLIALKESTFLIDYADRLYDLAFA